MNDKTTLAEKVLLAIAPTIVQTEQFRAYEELRAQYERNLKGKKDGPELEVAKKEFEAWRKAFSDGMIKETSIECVRLAYAIAEEFGLQGGELESALRLENALRKEKTTTLYGKNGPFIKQPDPIIVDMKDARI
jgi:hypothetical protein